MGSNLGGRAPNTGGAPMDDNFDDPETNEEVMGEELENMDLEEEVMDNATHCPICDDITGHVILKEKKVGNGADIMVRCEDCSAVQTVQFRPPAPITIPFILSDGPDSERVVLMIDADEEFYVNDVFEEKEKLWTINQIETKAGPMTTSSFADNIASINAVRTDMVRVKMTLTRGEESFADVLVVPQDTTFTARHLIEHDDETWRIRAIHTGAGRTLRGTVRAPDIKRMYLHEPPNPEHFVPRTPRERRQAWKEGKLGHNPNPIRPKEHVKGGVKPNTSSKRKKKKPRN